MAVPVEATASQGRLDLLVAKTTTGGLKMATDDVTTPGIYPAGTPSGGLYDLPRVGTAAQRVRIFFDGMAPTESDNLAVTIGKNTLRYGTVAAVGVGGAAVTTMLVL